MDPDFWMSLAICVALVGAALWLIRVHWQHWQEVDADESLPPRERDHLRRRHSRRMQTSTMLGFIGVAILAGRLFPPDDPSIITILYWFGVALLVVWMALLAMVDMIATRLYYGSMRRKADFERTKLEAQLQRIQKSQKEEQSNQPANESTSDDSAGNQSCEG
jgi:hypothetical protein